MIPSGLNKCKEFVLMEDPSQKERVINPDEKNIAGSSVNPIFLTIRRDITDEIRQRATTS